MSHTRLPQVTEQPHTQHMRAARRASEGQQEDARGKRDAGREENSQQARAVVAHKRAQLQIYCLGALHYQQPHTHESGEREGTGGDRLRFPRNGNGSCLATPPGRPRAWPNACHAQYHMVMQREAARGIARARNRPSSALAACVGWLPPHIAAPRPPPPAPIPSAPSPSARSRSTLCCTPSSAPPSRGCCACPPFWRRGNHKVTLQWYTELLCRTRMHMYVGDAVCVCECACVRVKSCVCGHEWHLWCDRQHSEKDD